VVAVPYVARSGYDADKFVGVEGELGFTRLADDAVTAVRQQLRAALEPRGLWEPERFGLWSVLVCSY
jgi:hypothetical protein